LDVDSDNSVFVIQTATNQYAIHQFKDYVTGSGSYTFRWKGKSDLAPNESSVVLQIYNFNLTTWETIDTDNSEIADTIFILESIVSDITDYNDNNLVVCRIYQLGI